MRLYCGTLIRTDNTPTGTISYTLGALGDNDRFETQVVTVDVAVPAETLLPRDQHAAIGFRTLAGAFVAAQNNEAASSKLRAHLGAGMPALVG